MDTDDRYTALWVSYSTLTDFSTCPRAYFLKNIYRGPTSGNKIAIMTPALALGQVVHDVINILSNIPTKERFIQSPVLRFASEWKKVSGIKGGFQSEQHEKTYKERGEDMMRRIMSNPGPLSELSVKLKQELPSIWLSKEDGIILCGKIDWLQYVPKTNSVHIIDFKTSMGREAQDSLQLPIYYILTKGVQKRDIDGVSYWYLNRNDTPVRMDVPNENDSLKRILDIARDMKLARKLKHFVCSHDGCAMCMPYERIVQGKAQRIGINEYKKDVYIVTTEETPLTNFSDSADDSALEDTSTII